MVYARTKLMIQDSLLRPRPKVFITYSGPHPERFYKEIPNLMHTYFRVSEHQLQEKKFVWSKGDPEKFSVTWEIDKDIDKFSYYWIEVKLSGTTSKGNGDAEISVEANLRTEYPQDTYWQKSLLYEIFRMLWHSTFYVPKKDEYIREGRRMVSGFVEQLKRLTGV